MPRLLVSSCATSDSCDQLFCHSWRLNNYYATTSLMINYSAMHSSVQLICHSYDILTTSGCAPPQPTQLGGGSPWTGKGRVAPPKRIKFQKIPNGLWPTPLIFGKSSVLVPSHVPKWQIAKKKDENLRNISSKMVTFLQVKSLQKEKMRQRMVVHKVDCITFAIYK